ncbi:MULTISPECIES: helix-turn-helix domain-containing protein [unclassified Bradyrhizobium]|uniref:helix-turn-helix domain-containing protein n=1 Tax=unclassified Bradyrhizobium TaxID=2631580 RepID=UPI002915E15A|nr:MULTISPECIES: helix-turn-helix domain-containing protein [unclassified Bradyrhizobium]
MPENRKKHNGKSKFYVSPTERLDLLFALTKAQAKEEAKGKKHKKLLEQVDLLVMVALIGHRNNQTGQCNPSHATIAAEIGVSVSTVQRSFKRLDAAGFLKAYAKSFKGLKTSSQVELEFQRGEQWITKLDDDQSPVTERSVNDDVTIGHADGSRSVTGDLADRSLMTDEHGELNSEKEHSEPNTVPNASRRRVPAGFGLECQLRGRQRQASNDNQTLDEQAAQSNRRKTAQWPDDYREQFWNVVPRKVGKDAAISELERIERSDTVEFKDIINGMRRYAQSPDVRRDVRDPDRRRFVSYPANWLAKRRWTDEYDLPGETMEERHRRVLARRTVAI